MIIHHGSTWWSNHHDGIGVAPCTVDRLESMIGYADGYVVVTRPDAAPRGTGTEYARGPESIIHASSPWEALALLDVDITRSLQ